MHTLTSSLASLFASAALFAASPAAAQADSDMVAANDLEGIVTVLREAGYDAEIHPYGDNKREISLAIGNWQGAVMPSDCDETEMTECETLILSVGFDRKTPMSPESVAAANRDHRYISVWIDDEGDPYAQWAILTRTSGIPKGVFLNALLRFAGVVNDFGGTVFEDDDPATDTSADNSEEGK